MNWISNFKKVTIRMKKHEDLQIILIYRYISWLLTSLFYIFNDMNASKSIFKVGVIGTLFVVSCVITNVYLKYKNQDSFLKLLIFVETFGIILLLIPTGGISSPFLWFALNPVLMASNFIGPKFCWFILFFYIATSTYLSKAFGFYDTRNAFLDYDKIYWILALILTNLALQMVVGLKKQLHQRSLEILKVNKKVKHLNKRYKESSDHIMSLYQVVEVFNSRSDRENLVNTIAEYASILSGSKIAFFFVDDYKDQDSYISVKSYNNIDMRLVVLNYIEKNYSKLVEIIEPQVYEGTEISEKKIMISPVRSNNTLIGFIGFEMQKNNSNEDLKYYLKQILFLTELSILVLDRLEFQKIADQLIVSEERNRIANEMHDNISQRLAGIQYMTYSLSSKYRTLGKEEFLENLKVVTTAANSVMQEMRICIRELSSRKQGVRDFTKKIEEFLEETSNLNDIKIESKIEKEVEILSAFYKKCIMRIIFETVGNAIKHSKCNKIEVFVIILNGDVEIRIRDNGIGFDVTRITDKKEHGLGLENINNLTNSIKGKLDIKIIKESGTGTEILVHIPAERKENLMI